MKVTDQQLGRFLDMIRDFAMRNGLTAEVETGFGMEKSDVRLSGNCRCKSYRVVWREVRSLTDAGTRIFADAMNVFGLTKNESFEIKNVIFNDPATIVLWADGTKTVVKCQEDDTYSEEMGLALCFAKKALGNKSNFNNVFKQWIPETQSDYVCCGMVELSQDMRSSAADALAKLAEKLRRPITRSEI